PSENESGVALTMPMTRGSSRSMSKRVVVQRMQGERFGGQKRQRGLKQAPLRGEGLEPQAALGAGSGVTAGVPPLPLPPPSPTGLRGVQSLGGRGGLPAMMSSSCSTSMVSHSSRAL